MFVFLRKYQVPVSSCFCVCLSLYILTAAARGHLKSDPVGPTLLWLLRPLQLASQTATGWIKDIQEAYFTLRSYEHENDRLRQKIVELEKERDRLLEAEATNRRLKQLLEFRSQMPANVVTATIIGASASSWFKSCLLDKGSADGIRKGMAVVTPLGALGRVIELAPRSAKVLLITDPNSGVDVAVQRTRARGIVSGSLENGPVMKYVKHSEDVQVGDRLITSGLDGVFPRGMMVKPFDDAAFALKVNQISEIIETQFGLHIIKCIGKKPARTVPFDEAQASIDTMLKQRSLSTELQSRLQKSRDAAIIVRSYETGA
jgi:rod shape-determining protein MreC